MKKIFLSGGALALALALATPAIGDAAAQAPSSNTTSSPQQTSSPQRKFPGMRMMTMQPVTPADAEATLKSRTAPSNLRGSATPNSELNLVAPPVKKN